MRRTYKSKKETAGAIDPRDVLLTLDEKSSVFDAFYIQNIKQTKKDMSVGSSMLFAASNKVRKRKYVKKLKNQEALFLPRELTTGTAFLTPNKSFRVNKAPDLFDQLLNSSCNKIATHEPVNLFRKQPAIQQKTYRKKKPKKNKINYSNSDTSDSDKENFNSSEEVNKTANTSDIKSHKLIIEKEIKSSPKYIDESINNIVNNLSILFTHVRNKTLETPKNENYNLTKHAHPFQSSPLCSTPFLGKYRGASIYRFSPISRSLNDSPMSVTVNEDSTDYAADDLYTTHKEENKINNDNIVKKQNVTEATIKETIVQSIVPEEKYKYNTFEIINKNNTTDVSVAYDTIDETSKTEIHSPILSIPAVNSNKREPRKLATYLSCMQTTEIEPFHGFEDIDLVGNNRLDAIMNKYMNIKNVLLDNSYTIPSPTTLSRDSTFGNIDLNMVKDKKVESSESNTSSAAESSDSESFYDTCNSDDHIEAPIENIEPIVIVERLNDSVFDKYYSQMTNYSVESNDFNTNSDSNAYVTVRLSDNISNSATIKSSNNSVISENSVEDNSFNIFIGNDENNGSIDSIEIDYNDKSIESKTEDICVSFVTTRRRNDLHSDSFIGLDNSIVSASSHDFVKTVISNKNSLEYTNYVTIEESIGNIDDTFNIQEEEVIDENEYKLSIRESYEKCEAELSPKVKKILTRKSARRSIKTNNKSKLSIQNKLPQIKDNVDGSLGIEAEEVDHNVTIEESIGNIDDTFNIQKEEVIDENEYKLSIRESYEKCEAELSPKLKKTLTRKSARRSIKANNKSKLPIQNKLPQIKDNVDGSLGIEAEEINQNDTEYYFSISESDEINKIKHMPKVKKKIGRKSGRESKAQKSKSSFNRVSKIEENADNTVKIVTRRSSRIYRDSIARECQNSSGYEDNTGNGSIFCEQPGIILQPGKKWERSLSIYRRLTTMVDHFDHSLTIDEEHNKVRKCGQSVINTLEVQDLKGSFHNDSINSRRSTFVSKPSRSTIKIVRESNTSRASLCSTIVCEDLEGFLGEDCDDTIVELSKLSIADSQHEVTIIEKFHDTSNRRTTARDYVLRRCNQADVLPFDECYPDPVLKNCRKIGEGVYGEVFLWRAGDGRARVLKVIPIAGDIKVNGEQQKDFHEVISEIVIAMELSALRAPIADIEQQLNEGKSLETLDLHSVENATDAFNEVLRVRCVSGSYPSRLLELWELYDECRGSENDNPAALPAHQQYIVLELGNAGQDLESYQFHNAEQAHALFKQIAFGLAVAEEAYQFEHRDLHWGNVLISPTEEKYASFVVRGRLHRVRRAGVRAAVIDYSLSRATLGRIALYNDLATDDALFEALGDYQFQLYRLMRDKLGNDWKNFEPYTNILWLHYTVDKMITALRYTRTNTKIHKHYIAKLKEIKNRILDYGSAVQYVLTDNEL